MTWRETIAKSSDYLKSKGVPDPQVAAELLAARLLKTGRGFLAPLLEKPVAETHVAAMRRALARLIAHEPLQYVLGEWDFRTLTLKCDRRALIPRPETEELVTRVLTHLRKQQKAQEDFNPFVVDVGTGTGAIILALAKEYAGVGGFLGTDVSEEALSLAKENAVRCQLNARVRFLPMDGLDELDEPQCIDVLVSNPPYIKSAVCETLDPRVKDFEPRLALDGGVTGLDFYDRYLSDALNLLKPGGAVFFEIGEDQGSAIAELMQTYGFSEIRVERDFAGHDRYASAVLAD